MAPVMGLRRGIPTSPPRRSGRSTKRPPGTHGRPRDGGGASAHASAPMAMSTAGDEAALACAPGEIDRIRQLGDTEPDFLSPPMISVHEHQTGVDGEAPHLGARTETCGLTAAFADEHSPRAAGGRGPSFKNSMPPLKP